MFGFTVELVERFKAGVQLVVGDHLGFLTQFYPVVDFRPHSYRPECRVAVMMKCDGTTIDMTVFDNEDVRVLVEAPHSRTQREELVALLDNLLG
jgi:hypothetical protein